MWQARWIVVLAAAFGLTGVSVRSQAGKPAASFEWNTYGGDLASSRYAPFDQINKDNFSKLQLIWRLNTTMFGPRPDTLYSATPLVIGGVLFTTAGTRRTVVTLNAVATVMKWRPVRPLVGVMVKRPELKSTLYWRFAGATTGTGSPFRVRVV